jgi:ATP-dependent DNA helicase RecG
MLPLEIYRNPYLVETMVNLNMIDTQGGGIKRMFQAQLRRGRPKGPAHSQPGL